MNEPRFDASSLPGSADGEISPASGQLDGTPRSGQPNPFLGIRFKCCRTYGRIYRNTEKTAYSGKCPKCFARVTVPIGEGGNSARFFNAG